MFGGDRAVLAAAKGAELRPSGSENALRGLVSPTRLGWASLLDRSTSVNLSRRLSAKKGRRRRPLPSKGPLGRRRRPGAPKAHGALKGPPLGGPGGGPWGRGSAALRAAPRLSSFGDQLGDDQLGADKLPQGRRVGAKHLMDFVLYRFPRARS